MPREHFGSGPLSLQRQTSVFLNCPYDSEFQPLFDAIVFACVCCGFTPRSALESSTVAEPRIARITRALFESKYSIHDLSRCSGEGDANLARFNMPLELGIALSLRYGSSTESELHDWLVMVPAGHQYQRFISDLAGFDPERHDGSVNGIVVPVMGWLATRPDAIETPHPRKVIGQIPAFAGEMKRLRQNWGPTPPWADVVLAAIRIAKKLALLRTR